MMSEPIPKRRQRVIEMPGNPPLKLRVNPVDECPNCQRTMTFNKAPQLLYLHSV